MGAVDIHLTQAEKKSIGEGKSHVYKNIPYGRTGDTFTVDGRQFEIVDVSERALKNIASKYYSMEGYDSPADFTVDWSARYSLNDPEFRLYIHWFRKIDGLRPGD